MMATAWISLPAAWKLQDVQAVLNVTTGVLCALGIFVFARLCWQSATAPVVQNRHVTLHSLLSVNTLGEALDVLLLLKLRLFSFRYLRVLAQCIVVACLTITAFLSGPIARYSTRRSHVVALADIPGFLAVKKFDSIAFANVEWNQTEVSLDKAGFPHDQLLDFLPDTSVDWVYRPEQWNSSWSLNCKPIVPIPVELSVTDNCTRLYSELSGLDNIISRYDHKYHYYTWDGFYSDPTLLKDVLMFLMGVNYGNENNEPHGTLVMNFTLAAIHLHHLQQKQNLSSTCQFAPGDVGHTSYTKIDCSLVRLEHIPDENHVAYPNGQDVKEILSAYTQYYQARFSRESTSDSPITMIAPQELMRFVQVYLIVKDIQYREPVTRRLSVEVKIVQLSAAFLAVGLLVALFCVLGIAKYVFFSLKHHKALVLTPQSKLDWMLQSVERSSGGFNTGRKSLKRSVTVREGEELRTLPRIKRKKAEFESAVYGAGAGQPWEPSAQLICDRTALGGQPPHSESQLTGTTETNSSLFWKAPFLPVDLGEDDYFLRVT